MPSIVIEGVMAYDDAVRGLRGCSWTLPRLDEIGHRLETQGSARLRRYDGLNLRLLVYTAWAHLIAQIELWLMA